MDKVMSEKIKCVKYKNNEIDSIWKCPNHKETYSDMDGETYRCDVCGEYTKLYYDDMQ